MQNSKSVDFTPLEKMMKGAETVAKAVGKTLGAGGQNVLIQTEQGVPHITKDGVTVANEINLKDPLEQMGVEIIRQAAISTYNKVGDATTTTTVLSHALIEEGSKSSVVNKIELKRSLEKVAKEAVENVKSLSTPCKDLDSVIKIATVSTNGDKQLGEIIGTAVFSTGNNGQFDIELSKDGQNSVEMVGGYRINCRVANIDFLRGQSTIQYENPLVLVTSKKILRQQDAVDIIEMVSDQGRPLVIICDEVGGESMSTMLLNVANGKSILALCPDFGRLPLTLKEHVMVDIATYLGAKYIPNDQALSFDNLSLNHFGTCGSIKTTDKSTILREPLESVEKSVLDRVKVIEEMSLNDEAYSVVHKARISALMSSICIIKIHAITPSELKEKHDAIDDAIKACRAAMSDGYVAGAGTTLHFTGEEILSRPRTSDIEKQAAEILSKALSVPMNLIAENAGFKVDRSLVGKYGYGLDARTGQVVNLTDMNIIDPTLGIIYAIHSAVSVAGLFLTTACAITNDESGQ